MKALDFRRFRIETKYTLLQVSIGVIYLWFGGLKFFNELSPAELLARETLTILTYGLIPESVCCMMLALLETTIGLLLITNVFQRIGILAALFHMIGTFTPMILMPETSFYDAPLVVTLTGQYILKNLIIVSALIVIYPGKKPPVKREYLTDQLLERYQ